MNILRSMHQRGHALLMTLVLTAVLTMAALLTVRTLSLNLRISSNYGAQLSAFEASEAARSLLGPVLSAHTRTRGWPQRLGGDVVDQNFAIIPDGLSIRRDASGALRNWQIANSEASTRFDPLALDEDATYSHDYGSSRAPLRLTASLAVYRLHAIPSAGSNTAFAQGYEGVGGGLPGGGGALIYYIHSEGRVDDAQARALTGAIYRSVLLP